MEKKRLHIKVKVISDKFSTQIEYYYKNKYIAFSSGGSHTFFWCAMKSSEDFPELQSLLPKDSKNRTN